MTYPVRARITISADTLTSDTTFDNQSESQRFGSVEHAVLQKAKPKRSASHQRYQWGARV